MPVLIVEGPYEIPYLTNNGIKRIDSQESIDFWNNQTAANLANKQGCYIFALRAGQGHTPWYVGKAGTGKKGCGFKQEVFTADKRIKFNSVLFQNTHGKPVLFFVAQPDNKRVVGNPVLSEMEKALIRYAFVKNPDLVNVANANTPDWSIKGVIRGGAGQPTVPARQFKNMMGI